MKQQIKELKDQLLERAIDNEIDKIFDFIHDITEWMYYEPGKRKMNICDYKLKNVLRGGSSIVHYEFIELYNRLNLLKQITKEYPENTFEYDFLIMKKWLDFFKPIYEDDLIRKYKAVLERNPDFDLTEIRMKYSWFYKRLLEL